ncbi:hypothetical protein ACFOWA_06705 [Pedobacter lithocola]|uniref:Gliding motility-associated protein GldM C-terminal domain-containing protein n=1 Tax=Pedobacter lithocola TaxID=1908239 RepID=A0ABV8P9Q6_9SPHI
MKNLISTILSLFLVIVFLQKSHAQEETRVKINLSVTANGKQINVPLNSVSTSVSRYYDEVNTTPVAAKGKDSTSTKADIPTSGFKAGIFYLNLDVKNLPDDVLRLIAVKKSSFDGIITITDSFGKLPTRTIKFFKATLYSFADQYSSSYYGDSIGNVSISLSCNSISINGISIEQ